MNKLLIISCIALCACSAGQGVYESKPVIGGQLTMVGYPHDNQVDYTTPTSAQAEPLRPYLQLNQGNNAETPTKFSVAPDGTVHAELGVTRAPILSITAAPDYTKYWLLGVSILAIAGGIYLMSTGWPTIGLRVLIAGVAGAVVSLTIEQYGWVYVLAILVGCAWIVWEKYQGYIIGLAETAGKDIEKALTPTSVVTTTTTASTPAASPALVPPANKPS